MMTITVRDQERQPWEELLTTTLDRRLHVRCQAILMASRGRRHRHMAEDLSLSVRTPKRWLPASHARGLAGLQLRWVPGRAAKIPAAWAPELLGWITRGPAGCGLDRAHWTDEELTTDLYHTQGLAVRTTTVRTCCQWHGVRPYRQTSQDLKGEPVQQATAPQDLRVLKKQPPRGTSSGCVKMKRVFRCSRPCGRPWGAKGTGRWWATWMVPIGSTSVGR
jgi:transposase